MTGIRLRRLPPLVGDAAWIDTGDGRIRTGTVRERTEGTYPTGTFTEVLIALDDEPATLLTLGIFQRPLEDAAVASHVRIPGWANSPSSASR